jgi:hypothetical protein
MTDEHRERIIEAMEYWAIRRTEHTPQFARLRDDSMRTIITAAALLDRDPVDMAAQLRDGRLATIIRAAEETIPLALDDPEPVRVSMAELLEEAATAIDAERDRYERRSKRIIKRFEVEARRLRDRAYQMGTWQSTWHNARASANADRDWQPRPPRVKPSLGR